MRIEIRRARLNEADEISQLGIRSKAHWGYTSEQMQVFKRELTILPETIEQRTTHVIEVNNNLIGYYTLVLQDADTIELEHLFVDPSYLRQGFGSQLLKHARVTASSLGFRRIVIQSDPNAEGFYVAHGARVIELIPSSIPGRILPLLELLLK